VESRDIGRINRHAALVNLINSKNTTFTARLDDRFKGLSIKQLREFTGEELDPKEVIQKEDSQKSASSNNLPSNFDVWTKWPNCEKTFKNIQNQAHCGSCYAVAVATALTDRRCIQSNGADTEQLSAWDIISCCQDCWGDGSNGCNGGYSAKAYDFYDTIGIVTGGSYNGGGCLPYKVSPTERSKTTPVCTKSCQSSYKKASYSNDKRSGGSYRTISKNTAEVMQEIFDNGPVTAGFTVYEDFHHYYQGVYKHVSGEKVGRHAVTIVGWGQTRDGTKYWRAANSWGPDWAGEDGFFRIFRGNDECGFEARIIAGRVQ